MARFISPLCHCLVPLESSSDKSCGVWTGSCWTGYQFTSWALPKEALSKPQANWVAALVCCCGHVCVLTLSFPFGINKIYLNLNTGLTPHSINYIITRPVYISRSKPKFLGVKQFKLHTCIIGHNMTQGIFQLCQAVLTNPHIMPELKHMGGGKPQAFRSTSLFLYLIYNGWLRGHLLLGVVMVWTHRASLFLGDELVLIEM